MEQWIHWLTSRETLRWVGGCWLGEVVGRQRCRRPAVWSTLLGLAQCGSEGRRRTGNSWPVSPCSDTSCCCEGSLAESSRTWHSSCWIFCNPARTELAGKNTAHHSSGTRRISQPETPSINESHKFPVDRLHIIMFSKITTMPMVTWSVVKSDESIVLMKAYPVLQCTAVLEINVHKTWRKSFETFATRISTIDVSTGILVAFISTGFNALKWMN